MFNPLRWLKRRGHVNELVWEARRMAEAAEAYMRYHTEKFYSGDRPPTGITPQVGRLRKALEPFGEGTIPERNRTPIRRCSAEPFQDA